LAWLASARILLALAALAALALTGCGGGGDAQTASAPGPEGGASSTAATTTSSSSKEEEGSGSSSSPSAGANQAGSGPSSSPSQGAGKHGAHVKLPKGQPEPTATPAEEAQATVADITLSMPALGPVPEGVATLPAAYTCDGGDSWPALEWQGVPAGSKELVLFAMNTQPVKGKLFFDWAIAGVDPGLKGMQAGRLPTNAVSGHNSYSQVGYSVCPPKGQTETYVFTLYALPQRLSPHTGFDPAKLREEALALSGNAGLLAVSYGR
jgi:phosphatidylethanolamine-binding protein (PEBP) family uncharacterized protein